MISILQTSKEFFPLWGLHTTIDTQSDTVKTSVSTIFTNGNKINPDVAYKGDTLKYLINGADSFRKVIGKIYDPTNVEIIGDF